MDDPFRFCRRKYYVANEWIRRRDLSKQSIAVWSQADGSLKKCGRRRHTGMNVHFGDQRARVRFYQGQIRLAVLVPSRHRIRWGHEIGASRREVGPSQQVRSQTR